jgi:ABC-type maltose transport system permease subunit
MYFSLPRWGGVIMVFKEVEKGAIMQELLTIIAVVIVAAIFVAIGVSVMAQTVTETSTALTDVNTVDPTYYDSLIASNQNAAELVENTTSYSNILVLAVIGGLALAAILAYMWLFGGMGGGANRMQAAY